ncbi:ATP-binding cassette domain-containing protein [Paramicrobacterium agarici]|uniref:Peptide/nickel transport system ATP-binding protein n=1 Tax=Paramicrobacterium agarici TaxID=630514 RepID=A0A2A9DV35_9MICO|nr:ATP-binding cassette domain-containing protein [Microbacterium agarici]PFG30015.1 peptide/nickel transport system ATP-binding protein [Microbacterium agarici]TQO23024.1 peptide/nickel transport system ATP-binding protein [Microbacterium agarici]
MTDAHTPLLQVKNLTKTFITQGSGVVFSGKNEFTAVDDVSFDVNPRETLAIVGESGSGKSTMARIAAKLLEPTSGNVLLEGNDVTQAKGKELAHFRSKVQVVFQDPFSSLNPKHTVERIIMAPLDYQGVKPPRKRRDFVRDLMDRVGLNPDHSQRYPGQFSGGQAQRIGIARALAVGPSLVVCDEAVSALDVSVQAVVIRLLKDLQRERDLSYIFIAHDLAVVRHIADQVAVVHKGKIVEQGDRDSIFDAPQHEYTRELLSAVPQINPEWEAARVANAEKERQ